MTVADYPDFMPTSQQMLAAYANITGQIASYIATGTAVGAPGGVPLLTYANTLVSNQSFSATGASTSFPATGVFTLDQIGYDGTITFQTSAGAATTLLVALNWSMAGVPMGSDFYYLIAGTSSNGVRFRGPTKGNQLQIQIEAFSGGPIAVSGFNFQQNSRSYDHDVWETVIFGGAYPGYGGATEADLEAGILAAYDQSVPANTTETLVMPLWTGKYTFSAVTASGGNDLAVSVSQTVDINALGGTSYQSPSNASGEIFQTDLYLPRAQCILKVRNGNAAPQVIQASLIKAEY